MNADIPTCRRDVGTPGFAYPNVAALGSILMPRGLVAFLMVTAFGSLLIFTGMACSYKRPCHRINCRFM
jgi:hypothetical protein